MERIELPKLNTEKYIGTRTEIVSATVELTQFGEVLRLQTAPIELKDGDTLPEGKHLSASIMLGLSKTKGGKLAVGIETKLDKWLQKHNIKPEQLPDDLKVGNRVMELEGMKVTVQQNKNGYLEIA